jgi:hypothetical protein
VNGKAGPIRHFAQRPQVSLAIGVIHEDRPAVDAAVDNMMRKARDRQPGQPRHPTS